MSVDRPDDASSPVRPRATAEPPDGCPALSSVVVRHDDAPDRRTVYPPEASEEARLTRWISANDAAFVRLDERR